VVNNPVGGVDGISDVRVVEHWPYVQGAPLSDDHDFADGSFGGAPQEDEGDNDSQRGRRGRFTGSSPLAPFPRSVNSSSTSRGGRVRLSAACSTLRFHSSRGLPVHSVLSPTLCRWSGSRRW
jgi:hypothetical protein